MNLNPIAYFRQVRDHVGAHIVTAGISTGISMLIENKVHVVNKVNKATEYFPGVAKWKQEYQARLEDRKIDQEMKRNLRDLIAREVQKNKK